MNSYNVFRQLFIICLPLAAVVLPRAAAQPIRGSSSSAYPYEIGGDVSSPLKIILAVLIFGMFFIAFFTLYLRKCFENSSGSRRTLATASNRRSRQKLPCGLESSIIDRFPVFLYSDVKELKIGKGALECAVCISVFADDERLRLLPKCEHVFHPECIDAWLASHTTCPVCRANLTPDKLGGDSESTQELTRSQIDEIRTENESQNQYIVDVEVEEQLSPKFPRSHSTGHSLVTPGENCERYTLRLPEEVRKQIAMLKRAKSCGCSVDLPHEESSGRCLREDGGCDGSSCREGRRWNPDRLFCRSDRWIFTVTRKPPFIAKPEPVEKSDRPQTSSSSAHHPPV